MATKADFSPEEWGLVYWAPKAAAGVIMEADLTFMSAAKETIAVMKAGHAARDKYPGNPLIQDLIPKARMKGEPEIPEPKSPFPNLKADDVIAKIREAVALVQQKAPAQAADYKAFVLELANVAANASGEGFLGTGQKVSEKEKAILDKLTAALA
jgi:hypothetical protein